MLDNINDVDKLTDIFKVMGASDEIISNVLTIKKLDDSIDDVTDSVHEFAKAGKGLDGIALAFKGMGGVIKSMTCC